MEILSLWTAKLLANIKVCSSVWQQDDTITCTCMRFPHRKSLIGLVRLVLVGQCYFTVGQRVRIRGRAQSLFVSGKDAQSNTVTGV